MNTGEHQLVQKWWVVALAALGAGAIVNMVAKGFPIVEFELAWSIGNAEEVLAGANLDAVKASIYWDFLFLALYAPALGLGALWARQQYLKPRLVLAGRYLAVAALAAGLFDIIENLAMLAYLNAWAGTSGWLLIAGLMAVPKFLIVIAAILYILAGSVIAGLALLSERSS